MSKNVRREVGRDLNGERKRENKCVLYVARGSTFNEVWKGNEQVKNIGVKNIWETDGDGCVMKSVDELRYKVGVVL